MGTSHSHVTILCLKSKISGAGVDPTRIPYDHIRQSYRNVFVYRTPHSGRLAMSPKLAVPTAIRFGESTPGLIKQVGIMNNRQITRVHAVKLKPISIFKAVLCKLFY